MPVPVIGITGRLDRSARPPNVSVIALSRTYVRAVKLGGGAPAIVMPYLEEAALRAIFNRLDGLLLSGGGDISPALFGEEDSGLLWSTDEQRDRAELKLARWALVEDLPLLGICRGAQMLNVAAGGTLIQDVATQVPNALTHSAVTGRPMASIAHTVEIAESSLLAQVFGAGELDVNSAHHQAAKAIGAKMVVTARAPDGIVEGIEAPEHPFCLGVQWHPEVMVDSYPIMCRLFEALVEAARARCT